MAVWKAEMDEGRTADAPDCFQRPKPWRRKQTFSKTDVVGKLHLVLADGVYVDTLNLMPRIQNQIRSLAAFDNPIYYKNKRLGYSNYDHFSTVYLGKDLDGYIRIPRGLREKLVGLCQEADIEYDLTDHREKGMPIQVSFRGDLRIGQDLAADRMLQYDHGVLSAATAFGKTVVCSYLIAQRKVNTLILLQSKDLLEQWVEELSRFLVIQEEAPEYKTKTGRVKKRESVIGVLTGNKDTLTGIVDVAMVGLMYRKGDFHERLPSYGMVIMDECHHCGAHTAVEVMQKINAKYVYGVSATLKRGDQLEKIIPMLLGPVRHSYTAKERAADQGIGHYVYPRFTRVIDIRTIDGKESRSDITGAYALISENLVRNEMIMEDTKKAVAAGRTPVILTRYKEQAKYLYNHLSGAADHVFLLYGDNSDKENSQIRRNLKDVPRDQSLILIATGQKIGEGFDYPRLDTLMLAAPVSFAGRLEQYIGRLNRDYEGKEDVIVYDYVDPHIRVFENMYAKRLRAYRRGGYTIISNPILDKQTANAIYDAGNYTEVFEQDLVEAEKRIIVSSPEISQDKIARFLYVVLSRQEAGCSVIVITRDPETSSFGSAEYLYGMIKQLQDAGVRVLLKEDVAEHFAVIDEKLVWHGGMNLLGKEDAWDNLMRIKSAGVAEELVEISMGRMAED